jgi:Domain of unknown function (DUF4276)
MNKLAVFVEGQTEQIFVKKLLEEIAGEKNVRIRLEKSTGGRNASKRIEVIEAERAEPEARYYIQIVDCSGESRVASEIRDTYAILERRGFSAIVGLRDVFPLDRARIPDIRKAMTYRLRTQPIAVTQILAIMEVEAWFLAEHHHFAKIDPALTLAAIQGALRFDPNADDVEARDHPAEDLDRIYRLAGRSYRKNKATVHGTVDALDYAHLYLDLRARVGSLGVLVEAFDRFLA